MKIAIYTPYLDTAGGGEKYMLTIASILAEKEEVDVLLDDHLLSLDISEIKKKIELLHDLDLAKINFIKAPMGSGNFLKRLFFLRKYDWLFYLTDGSIFFSTAKNNCLNFQVPFENTKQGLWQRIKLSSWQKIIFNSKFTQNLVQGSWKMKGEVIYPPVETSKFKPLSKKKQIVSVGRFFGYLKSKKQDFLIKCFKKLVDKGDLKDWSLHLAGGAGEGDEQYLKELQNLGRGYQVYLQPNLSFANLQKLYGESEIYWHAAGFEETDPTKFEHFGITTVEAMAAGCVPVAINLGGQTEIVENGVSGWLWDSQEQLIEKTLELVKNREEILKMSKDASLRAELFSKKTFGDNIKRLVYE